ncbi:MAG: molybdate transport system substrate-binding protein [Actinomycetota bacterium]|nr:molybdate transport system substrate-binding protein [Actinomycetota bacterium]
MRRISVLLAISLPLTLALTACGSSAKTSSPSSSTKPGGSIKVLAASSLTKGFTALAKQFESAHPGSHVNLSFASSSILAEQIQSGAPADVFASADQKNMSKLQTAGAVTGTPEVFAKNQMEIAVAPGNPKHIATVSDLAKSGIIVVLCASEAPCGKYADQLLEQDKVTLTPKSRELDVKATLTKVASGDADAAIVYVTDVKGASGNVDGIEIPAGQNVFATLPIAALKDAKNAALADAWVTFVTSSTTEKTLQDQYDFLAP